MRLQEAITHAGITREQACVAMGCSLSVLQRMLKGDAEPSALEVYRLAGATGLSFGWFAGEAASGEARAARAADNAERIVREMRAALDQLLAELTRERSAAIAGLVDEVKVGVAGGAGDRGVGRADTSRRKKRAKQVSEPVTPAREASG